MTKGIIGGEMAKYDGTYERKDRNGRPRRYAICKVSGNEWNIAIGQIVKKMNYVCPKCLRKEFRHE